MRQREEASDVGGGRPQVGEEEGSGSQNEAKGQADQWKQRLAS